MDLQMSSADQHDEMNLRFHNPQYRNDGPIETMENMQKMRKKQEKILQSFNTPTYGLLEYGAEAMLWYERVADKVKSVFSTESIVEGISNMVSYASTLFKPQTPKPPTTKSPEIDAIQQQLDFVMKQMEAVKQENQRKTEELQQLKDHIVANSGAGSPIFNPSSPPASISNPLPSHNAQCSAPVPPPFPSQLDRYSQQTENTIASPVIQPRDIPSSSSLPTSPNRRVQKPSPPPFPPSLKTNTKPSSPVLNKKQKPALPPPLPPQTTVNSYPSRQRELEEKRKSVLNNNTTQRHQRPSILLNEIHNAPKLIKLRKVPKMADGTPTRQPVENDQHDQHDQHEPNYNDEIRQKMRERIQMLEESESESDIPWRESDVF